MKRIKLNALFVALIAVAFLSSCHKDKVDPNKGNPTATRAGIYVMNQGGFQANNSTLTYYDFDTKNLTADLYASANGSGLGDTGNDAQIYGSKMYIVVNFSSVLDVVNAKTGKLIKSISMLNSGVKREPRSVAFDKGNAFITSYDGTVAVLDTATLGITKYINVGRNPEQLVVSNGKLYVANSGGLSFGNPDNTVSVIDLNSLTETKKITVRANPISVAADTYGHVYVLSAGDFADIQPGMTIIDNTTDVASAPTTLSLGYNIPMAASGDFVYYPTADNKIAVFNAKTQTAGATNFISDGTVLTSPYAISVDSQSGEVFVTDAKDYSSNGTLYAFDKTGKMEYSFTTGINPGKITLLNK